MDALDRAYATLELPRGCTSSDVRRHFKALARRWHPDRFVGDPQGQVEAAQRMRAINAAYELIQAAAGRPLPPSEPMAAGSAAGQGEPREVHVQPLGRDAIEGIVRCIGKESPVDVLFAFLAWSWPLFLALLIAPPRYQWLNDELAGRPHHSVVGWQLFLVGLAVFLRFRQRRSRPERS